MVDFGFKAQTEDKHRTKKRKLRSVEENGKFSKAARVVQVKESRQSADEEMDEEQRNKNKKIMQGGHWKKLDFILSIQNRNLDLQRKLELAFEFVNSMKLKEEDESDGGLSDSRLIAFLNDWIQCRLISLDEKETVEGKKPQLDFRCWEIFKFCLEKSLCLTVPLSFKPTLLRALSYIGTDALSMLEEKESFARSERSALYSLISDCVSLIFSSHGRRFKADMGLWSSIVSTILGLVHKIYVVKVSNDGVGPLLLRLSCLILESFANFLKVHLTPKNIFRDFVKTLLEPLLSLLVTLNAQIDGSNSAWTRNLLKTVEDILSNGLFHPVHIEGNDGFLSSNKDKIDEFFGKLHLIMSEKKMSVLGGVGELFHLFVIRVKKQKGVPVLSEGIKMTGETGVSGHSAKVDTSSVSKVSVGNGSAVTESTYSSNRLDVETGKSLFGIFERFIEPLMLDLKRYSEANLAVGPMLLDAAHYTLEATNKILAAFMHEKIYLRTEDTSDGVRLNFLKKFYEILISFSRNIHLLWLSGLKIDDRRLIEMLPLVVKEIIVALGYFLEIEYEVVGDDLVSLWTTMFSYLAIDSAVGTPVRCSLASHILHLGCQLINIYSDLRQVSNPIFALCKAVRLFEIPDNDCYKNSRSVSCTPLSSEAWVKSVKTLLCFQEFRLAICKAIKLIPEGQANGCIQRLKMDISESLDWIKASCSRDKEKELGELKRSCSMQNLNLQAELLGVALSEVYTIVLDYLAVTTGNSVVIGNSIKDLMKEIGPSLSILVGKQLDHVTEFLFSVTGRRFSNKKTSRFSVSWVFLFFFRVYVSCRSLYRQSISLMPPDSSKKASEAIGDFFTAYSGEDCMGSTEWRDEGYFSWIIKPTESLWTILKSVSDFCLQGTVAGYAPLVHVMHTMACQRLVDLNKLIKGFEFLKEGAVRRRREMKSMDDASLPLFRKESKKWKENISVLRKEAKNVTRFLLEDLPLVVKKVESIFADACVTFEGKEKQAAHDDDAWDLGVPSLTEKSLPTSVWYLLCQNTDIWCPHATKAELEKFLFLLFHIFLSSARGSCKDVIKHKMDKPRNLDEVTLHEISLELLCDTIFYEQTFLCRHLTSSFCRVLEKSVSQLFSDSLPRDVDFSDSDKKNVDFSDWLEVLSKLEKTSVVLLNKRDVADDEFSALKPDSLPSDSPSMKYSKELTACQSLLNLLCWMPKGSSILESFSDYATYILKLERAVVFSLLDYHGKVKGDNHYELFRLFLCCRKALKGLLMTFCEENSEVKQSSIVPIFSENSNSVLWLLKSVSALLRLLPAFPEEHASQVKYMSFSLMDHTSYVILALTKEQFRLAIPSLIDEEKPIAELPISVGLSKKDSFSESDPSLGAWMEHITESLKENAQILLPYEKLNAGLDVVDLNNLSSIVSCTQGFLWGIEETKLLSRRLAHRSKLNHFIAFFEKFINSCFHALLVKDSRQHDGSYNDRILEPDCENGSRLEDSSPLQEENFAGRRDALLSGLNDDPEKMQSSGNNFVENFGIQKKCFKSNNADFAVNIISEVDSYERQLLKKPLLQSLLKGDNPEVAFSVRQLFIESSAILSLKLQIYGSNLSSSFMPIPIGTSQFLLMELAKMVEEPHSFSYVWLDGVLKYLEVLGSYTSLTKSTSSDVYARLIDMHLRAIGRCISLQGKGATLASHETESSTKTLMGQIGSSKLSLGHGQYSLDEFKARLRMSFKVLIKEPLELHQLAAVEALESALVGVNERCNMIYEINTGGPEGGHVSSIVAAGVDCFDLVLESVSGSKRLSTLKGHIQSSIGALFNIVLHLQGPLIFYEKLSCNNGNIGPDPGAVILMCVEMLMKIAGKPTFQMDSSHVVQSLRLPAALFQDFCHLRSSQSPSNSSMLSANQDLTPVAGMLTYIIDQQFSVDLFAACCRLLSTVLRHHTTKSERCISVLQDSVCVLLHCLETRDTELVDRKGYYAWDVQQGIKCASFLRRIYEEIKQQKEVIGRYTSHFLSNYIWVYSGYGPSKTGIKREIDEALRPGIYALVDACSTDELQHLHMVLGEGPCRSTLATLQHDYKLNFQYEGKV